MAANIVISNTHAPQTPGLEQELEALHTSVDVSQNPLLGLFLMCPMLLVHRRLWRRNLCRPPSMWTWTCSASSKKSWSGAAASGNKV